MKDKENTFKLVWKKRDHQILATRARSETLAEWTEMMSLTFSFSRDLLNNYCAPGIMLESLQTPQSLPPEAPQYKTKQLVL